MTLNIFKRGYKNAKVLDEFNSNLNNLGIEVVQ